MYSYVEHTLKTKAIRTTVFLAGVTVLIVTPGIVQAQSNQSSGLNNTPSNSGLGSSVGQFDNLRPIRQPNFLFDSNRGSQQFFRQGREELYLLPEEKPEPILEIDEAVETEGINFQDLPPDTIDE